MSWAGDKGAASKESSARLVTFGIRSSTQSPLEHTALAAAAYAVRVQWYESEVQGLERAGRQQNGKTRPAVFYGSSSIRLWTTLAEDFDSCVLNLGFGGSTLEACNYYFERLVPPRNPRSLLLYAGDNDLGDGRSVEHVLGSFHSLSEKVSNSLGDIPFGFISIKPSPSRFSIIDKIRRLNDGVRKATGARSGGYFVDVFPAMLDRSGRPNAELFLSDGLHLSRAGYRLWGKLLEPYRNRIFTD